KSVAKYMPRGAWARGLFQLSGPDPVGVKRPLLVHPLIGVSAEVVALRLQQVGREPLAPIAVKIRESRGKTGYRQPEFDRRGPHRGRARLGLGGGGGKNLAKERVPGAGVRVEGALDSFEDRARDDAPAAPQQRNIAVIQFPLEFARRRLQLH